MKRPDIHDKTLIEEAVRHSQNLNCVMMDVEEEDGEKDSVVNDIVAAFGDNPDDGYEVVKYLENRRYWEGSSELVDAFNSMFFDISRTHEKWVKQWVIENHIKPALKVGDDVVLKNFNCRGKDVRGKVVEIFTDKAEYIIFCAELGHVRSGTGSYGVVLPFEQVEDNMEVGRLAIAEES
ncbi:MAG: hypothetical protein HC888_02495 [Candidatus Competibacteraceae bacterium]|nr:hypothetical protein [Candidatus Competibacteraceae bacterium]